MDHHVLRIASELNLPSKSAQAAIDLLDTGSTIPFIARYRKEKTGNLDEVLITQIRDRIHDLRELDKRREVVLRSIEEQKKLTKELKEKILAVQTLSILEDLYLPYRPKRRTRATVAKEKGLEPLARFIFEQKGLDVIKEAQKYLTRLAPPNEENKLMSVDEALAGARDIIAEWISEDSQARQELRTLYQKEGLIHSKVIKGKEEEALNYRDYFDWQEAIPKAVSHRILAVRRGEKEKYLTIRIVVPQEKAVGILGKYFIKGTGEDSNQVRLAIEDSFKRLLSLSLETEIRLELKNKADQDAIVIFKNNLKELLMAPPLGSKQMLAIDPGLRTGCKMVVINKEGRLERHETIYLVGTAQEKDEAIKVLKNLCQQFKIEVIAIGNGTASRETESFVRYIEELKNIPVVLVSETGASVYSASDVAWEEFPDYDVTIRGAVSIGRRLMDPLAELVKIDPKAIGVGQYQHDVDQTLLQQGLDDVVISCVNQVGVHINTASQQLLSYVSGIGKVRATAIMEYRRKQGFFKSRQEFLRVSGFGPKVFEQAAGFLRIQEAQNPLDSSSVHPESYPIVQKMAQDLKCSIKDLIVNKTLQQNIELQKYVSQEIGMPTLLDIKGELAKPGRDPREPFHFFQFKEDVHTIDDLKPGMVLPGVVTNITAFGAFVDIGIHHDGLIHLSQLSDRFVKDPRDIVHIHQQVVVTVLEIDLVRKRVALTLKKR